MEIVQPETLGFSSDRLARINLTMQRYVDEGKLAGILTLVSRHGKVAHLATFGMADIEDDHLMQQDTIFRIYSMTKPITSAAVMMLYEEGRFRLSEPVANFIPAFKKMKVLDNAPGSGVCYAETVRPVSIRDLLSHTAGLSYGFDDNTYIDELYRRHIHPLENRPETTLEMAVNEIAKLPLAHQPGTAWRYSFATDVLGYLVQVVSGMPFEDFLKRRIFDPLGMPDTGFFVPQTKISRFAACYGLDLVRGMKLIDPPSNPRYLNPPKDPSGGGGLVSTASDYLRFAQMLLNGGVLDGVRLLGRKTVELMTANHLPDGVYSSDDHSSGFGLGVNVLLDVAKAQLPGSLGTYGWSGAANTNFWVDPVEDLIGILLLQYMPMDTYPVIPDFRTLTYQALV